MDYRKAYEALSKAVWEYDKAHSDAWVHLMLVVREIEQSLDGAPAAPLELRSRHDTDK